MFMVGLHECAQKVYICEQRRKADMLHPFLIQTDRQTNANSTLQVLLKSSHKVRSLIMAQGKLFSGVMGLRYAQAVDLVGGDYHPAYEVQVRQ